MVDKRKVQIGDRFIRMCDRYKFTVLTSPVSTGFSTTCEIIADGSKTPQTINTNTLRSDYERFDG